MSGETWIKEYYPTPPNAARTPLEATEHSLRKWIGLLPENLKRHGCRKLGCCIVDKDGVVIDVDSSSCALCWHFHNVCSQCSLCETLGKPCSGDYGTGTAPYDVFESRGERKPMIAALEKTARRLRRRKR